MGMVIVRKRGVPGEELPFAWGSWRYVGWLNGHPDFRQGPDLSAVRRIAVIGNGNVALDVARVLAKSADEMAKSDIVPEAGAAIAAAPITDIYVIGRRGPEHASFTNNELAETGRLARRWGGAVSQGRGHLPCQLGQARAHRHHPDQPRREPCGGRAGARLAEGPRPHERARSHAVVGRRRGLAPHRQGRGCGRRQAWPASREVDGLEGPLGGRARGVSALFCAPGNRERDPCWAVVSS